LRVLNLPASVRDMVRGSQLTLGHARALLALGDERAIIALAHEVIARELTVRDVEQRVRNQTAQPEKRRSKAEGAGPNKSPEVKRLEGELRRHLQTDVTIALGERDRGRIEIAFYSVDDLDRVLELVLGSRRERL
jgi:ParB family transcriptional regulator, chromosome partitioning protein